MDAFLLITNIVLSTVIICMILLQNRGAGLGSAWGGAADSVSTRRGMDLVILQVTVFFIAVFFVLSVVKLAS